MLPDMGERAFRASAALPPSLTLSLSLSLSLSFSLSSFLPSLDVRGRLRTCRTRTRMEPPSGYRSTCAPFARDLLAIFHPRDSDYLRLLSLSPPLFFFFSFHEPPWQLFFSLFFFFFFVFVNLPRDSPSSGNFSGAALGFCSWRFLPVGFFFVCFFRFFFFLFLRIVLESQMQLRARLLTTIEILR